MQQMDNTYHEPSRNVECTHLGGTKSVSLISNHHFLPQPQTLTVTTAQDQWTLHKRRSWPAVGYHWSPQWSLPALETDGSRRTSLPCSIAHCSPIRTLALWQDPWAGHGGEVATTSSPLPLWDFHQSSHITMPRKPSFHLVPTNSQSFFLKSPSLPPPHQSLHLLFCSLFYHFPRFRSSILSQPPWSILDPSD